MFVSIAMTWVSLCVVWCFRLYLVHKYRMRRLIELNLFLKGHTLVNSGSVEDLRNVIAIIDSLVEAFEDLKKYDHLERHVLDLTKWSYRQFFPQQLERE